MKKCIIWGMGEVFSSNLYLIRWHESKGHFKVIGITADKYTSHDNIDYCFYNKSELISLEFDIILIMSNTYQKEIREEAIKMGIADENIVMYGWLSSPSLDIDLYMKIKKNPPTILANNCWGGLTYHSLGLKFNSPLINMNMTDNDYMKLLEDPQKYIKSELKHIGTGHNIYLDIDYPIVGCHDICMNFNHDQSFDVVRENWERRKQRINWNNMLVMMYTHNKDVAERFSKLPYKRKVCFVPFSTNYDCVHYIDLVEQKTETPFYQIVNSMAQLENAYYDVLELLATGRFIKVSDGYR